MRARASEARLSQQLAQLHPDANRHLDGELRAASQRDRQAHHRGLRGAARPAAPPGVRPQLESGAPMRMQLADAAAEADRAASQERGGRTPQGRQYFKLAEADIAQRQLGRRRAEPPDRADLRARQRAVQGAARPGEEGAALTLGGSGLTGACACWHACRRPQEDPPMAPEAAAAASGPRPSSTS